MKLRQTATIELEWEDYLCVTVHPMSDDPERVHAVAIHTSLGGIHFPCVEKLTHMEAQERGLITGDPRDVAWDGGLIAVEVPAATRKKWARELRRAAEAIFPQEE